MWETLLAPALFLSLVKTDRTKSPGLDSDSLTRKVSGSSRATRSFSAFGPDRWPWYHLGHEHMHWWFTNALLCHTWIYQLLLCAEEEVQRFAISSLSCTLSVCHFDKWEAAAKIRLIINSLFSLPPSCRLWAEPCCMSAERPQCPIQVYFRAQPKTANFAFFVGLTDRILLIVMPFIVHTVFALMNALLGPSCVVT